MNTSQKLRIEECQKLPLVPGLNGNVKRENGG